MTVRTGVGLGGSGATGGISFCVELRNVHSCCKDYYLDSCDFISRTKLIIKIIPIEKIEAKRKDIQR